MKVKNILITVGVIVVIGLAIACILIFGDFNKDNTFENKIVDKASGMDETNTNSNENVVADENNANEEQNTIKNENTIINNSTATNNSTTANNSTATNNNTTTNNSTATNNNTTANNSTATNNNTTANNNSNISWVGMYSNKEENANYYHEANVKFENQTSKSINFTMSAVHGRDAEHVNIGEVKGTAKLASSKTMHYEGETEYDSYVYEETIDGEIYRIKFTFNKGNMTFQWVDVKQDFPNGKNPYAGNNVSFDGEYYFEQEEKPVAVNVKDFGNEDLNIKGIKLGYSENQIKAILGEEDHVRQWSNEESTGEKGVDLGYDKIGLTVSVEATRGAKDIVYNGNDAVVRGLKKSSTVEDIKKAFKAESILENSKERVVVGYPGDDAEYNVNGKGKIYFSIEAGKVTSIAISYGHGN